ncbi:MAG TPA: hypothetical protein VF342_16275 [Alphaproteobacteria bacterium]
MIPEPVLRFVRSTIKSVWALELLLLIRRTAPREWTVEGLTAELRSSPLVVTEILSAFQRSGIIRAKDERYHYEVSNPEQEELIQAVERIYAERPFALIREIISAPNEKIQTFADAFKFKKD